MEQHRRKQKKYIFPLRLFYACLSLSKIQKKSWMQNAKYLKTPETIFRAKCSDVWNIKLCKTWAKLAEPLFFAKVFLDIKYLTGDWIKFFCKSLTSLLQFVKLNFILVSCKQIPCLELTIIKKYFQGLFSILKCVGEKQTVVKIVFF